MKLTLLFSPVSNLFGILDMTGGGDVTQLCSLERTAAPVITPITRSYIAIQELLRDRPVDDIRRPR